jgi:hypothetical protein
MLRQARDSEADNPSSAWCDSVCDLVSVPAQANHRSSGSMKLTYASRDSVWHLTPEETGLRQLLIVSLLLPFLEHEGRQNS